MLRVGCIDSWTRGSSVVHCGPVATITALLDGEGPASTLSHMSSPWLLGESERRGGRRERWRGIDSHRCDVLSKDEGRKMRFRVRWRKGGAASPFIAGQPYTSME
jgi:hypothetical protein